MKKFNKVWLQAKKYLGNEICKKVDKIHDQKERAESLKYIISSKMELEYLDLEKKFSEINGNSLIAQAKLSRLKSKINLFKSSFSKEDFQTALKNIEETKKVIEQNV